MYGHSNLWLSYECILPKGKITQGITYCKLEILWISRITLKSVELLYYLFYFYQKLVESKIRNKMY